MEIMSALISFASGLIVTGLLARLQELAGTRVVVATSFVLGVVALNFEFGGSIRNLITIDIEARPWTFMLVYLMSQALSEDWWKLLGVVIAAMIHMRLIGPISLPHWLAFGMAVGFGFASMESHDDPVGVGDRIVLHAAYTGYAAVMLGDGLANGRRRWLWNLILVLVWPSLLHLFHNLLQIADRWFDAFDISSTLLEFLTDVGISLATLVIDFGIFVVVTVHISIILGRAGKTPSDKTILRDALIVGGCAFLIGKVLNIPGAVHDLQDDMT